MRYSTRNDRDLLRSRFFYIWSSILTALNHLQARGAGLLSVFLVLILTTGTLAQIHVRLPQTQKWPKYRITGPTQQQLVPTRLRSLAKPSGRERFRTGSQTLRILGLRVAFQPDTLPTTTGNGQFILTESDTVIIDPPPHDREYFLAQMAAAADYYRKVSNGKLTLVGDVFPIQNDACYVLPHTMDYYNPDGDRDLKDRRLAELFRDAIQVAHETDDIPFGDFDIFVVFHAGVGQDFGDEFDLTPNDIPSAFLNHRFLARQLGGNDPSFPGIPADNTFIREGIILPEWQNQNGSVFALKGTFVFLLGKQLGLPVLYQPDTGRPGVGSWALMDAGASNYFGIFPAEPCAWAKVFMGWENPLLLQPRKTIPVGSRLAQSAPHIYKIPISDTEYFLVENRRTDFDGNGIAVGRDIYGHRLEFHPDGTFTAELDTAAGERLGVITQLDEYDFALPGSGILIWHIDEEVIRRNYEEDRVNADPEHRGVDLEEADGSQDIGQSYGFLSPGSGSEYGVAEDAFFADNQAHKIANSSETVRFAPDTSPWSRNYAGANTGIELFAFSNPDSVMTFSYVNSLWFPGFPVRYLPASKILTPTVLHPKTGNATVLVAGGRYLYLWDEEGQPLVQPIQTVLVRWNGHYDTLSVPIADSTKGAFISPPVLLEADQDGFLAEFAIASSQDGIRIYDTDSPGNAPFSLLGKADIPVTKLMAWGNSFYAISQNRLVRLKSSGEFLWEHQAPETIADMASLVRDGETQIALITESGTVQVLAPDGSVQRQVELPQADTGWFALAAATQQGDGRTWLVAASREQILLVDTNEPDKQIPILPSPSVLGPPALADLNFDGQLDVVFITANRVEAYQRNGVRCEGFPVSLKTPLSEEVFPYASPVVLRYEKENRICVRDGAGQILILDGTGQRIDSFYLAAGSGSAVPLLAADTFSGNIPVILAPSADGFLWALKLPAQGWQPNASWLYPGKDASSSKFLTLPQASQHTAAGSLMPFAYNYPNPTRGTRTAFRFYLREDARITITIYDMSGEKVDEIRGQGLGGMENELEWNATRVSDGVYLARIEAKNGTDRSVKIVKVAVIR